jgi:hypothetical protein
MVQRRQREKDDALQKMETRRTQQILESQMVERGFTVAMYFCNILSLVITMLLYYGLMIIMSITFMIALYDYNYNYDDYMVYHA